MGYHQTAVGCESCYCDIVNGYWRRCCGITLCDGCQCPKCEANWLSIEKVDEFQLTVRMDRRTFAGMVAHYLQSGECPGKIERAILEGLTGEKVEEFNGESKEVQEALADD